MPMLKIFLFKYGDMHRFVGVASQSWNYGSNNQWGTTVTTFFEFNRGGRYSYTYAGDIMEMGEVEMIYCMFLLFQRFTK